MALATQCPHCHTTFRVAVDQLKLRGGIVRCGQCQEVFDGNACIVDLSKRAATPAPAAETPVYAIDLTHTLDPLGILPQPEAEAEAAPSAPPTPAPAVPEFTLDLIDPEPEAPAAPANAAPPDTPLFADLLARQLEEQTSSPAPAPLMPAPPLPPAPAAAAPAHIELDLNLEEEAPAPAPARTPFSAWQPGVVLKQEPTLAPAAPELPEIDLPPPTPAPAAEASTAPAPDARIEPRLDPSPRLDLVVGDQDEDDAPEFVKRGRAEEQHGARRRLLLGLASLVLLLLLAAQSLLAWRQQLALQLPALRPLITALGEPLGLRIALPMQIDQMSIETGELQTLAGGIHSYTTLLRNQSALPQAWPAIELRLRDDKRQLLLRRVLYPKDYLPANIDPAKGFAPRSEQAVLLHFDLGSVTAAAYDVGIFYP
ncbi:DUF3426 domain-containing protein [Massilia sp. TS11]|uniref:DUF3426 domain-containing protein n=1 Tax=Massilia sp. TS11 TaxID=2908003 RepID=UPI001EDAC564|nr:DUF3426 domain-containing protein [Massilia sp. TS11]MCG2583434.1 DUF3426 domain-containing protein [Massilia sp. TS11]